MAAKSLRLIRNHAVELSQATLRRLCRRAIFEVKVSVEQTRLQWQQRAAGNVRLNGSLAEGGTWADLPQRLRRNRQPRFLPDASLRDQTRFRLSSFAPEAPDLIVTEADQICEHVFDLLGSGPTPLGGKIDWHTDFKTRHRWNPQTYYKRIRPAPYPGGYDIKVPWELSRCQHFVRLGQAYWITGDEKYAREFVAQVSDWIDTNPWPWGVNWACTMDVAIRAVNWLWGYAFFRDAPCLTDEFLLTLWQSLLVHGRHIYRNLENNGGFTNNHYLADLVGLIYLGTLCSEFNEAAEWRDFGLRELWQEMAKQVYPDGVSFEASIPYHRLAAELFLSPVILCRLNEIPVPDEVMIRLEKMLEFVMHYTRPDGTVPLIGDADNGRLHRLKAWDPPEREWNDHRYLLAIGAILFDRQDFAQAAGDQWEEAVWLLGNEALGVQQQIRTKSQRPVDLGFRVFPDGGIYVLHHDNLHLVVDCGPIGQSGRGGHAHNDVLSFELFIKDRPWIVDPGTYAYTSDYESRHQFRSTGYHNAPQILGPQVLEQNRCDAHRPFQLEQDAVCSSMADVVSGRYIRLKSTLTNYAGRSIQINRKIVIDTVLSACVVRDELPKQVDYQFMVNLHCNVLPISSVDGFPGSYVLGQNDSFLFVYLMSSPGIENHLRSGWIARSYGDRTETSYISYTGSKYGAEQSLEVGFIWVESLSPLSFSRAACVLQDVRQLAESDHLRNTHAR